MLCFGRTHQEPQPSAVFGSQLQSPENATIDRPHPTQRGGDAGAAQRLFERPDGFLPVLRLNHDRSLEIEPQPGRGRRIKLTAVVDHHEGSAFLQSLNDCRQRQPRCPTTRPRDNPFDQHAGPKGICREEPIEGGDAGRREGFRALGLRFGTVPLPQAVFELPQYQGMVVRRHTEHHAKEGRMRNAECRKRAVTRNSIQ